MNAVGQLPGGVRASPIGVARPAVARAPSVTALRGRTRCTASSATAGPRWERSYLGYPTSDEFAIAGGRRTNFERGYTTFTASTGRVVDRRY
jgi:hypothetical protein